MTRARCLMVQGTGSGAGKSLITTALCRIFARAGWRVAPFKSQNMALNAAVTIDGGEIGRAQAVQAEAAGVEATVDMNPILLKPEGECACQLVVRGRAVRSLTFAAYAAMRDELLGVVTESLERLRGAHDLVVIEGAGSPAEINLAAHEIVNMRIARLADAPVLLVGDIDRGGVFAAFVGTLALLEPADRARVRGLIVNKFRGDPALLSPALVDVFARTGVPVLGVVPHLGARLVADEDSLGLDDPAPPDADVRLDIAVIRLPRISNFDDFDPLAREPGVRVTYATRAAGLARADLIVLPGSKSTIADLDWLRATGLADAVIAAAAGGAAVVGICGGYQMLGAMLLDPDGVESSRPSAPGLGLLPHATTFTRDKATVRVEGRVRPAPGLFAAAAGAPLAAYEIHCGRSAAAPARAPFVVERRGGVAVADPDGGLDASGAVVGTYLHGLFANDRLRGALLHALAARRGIAPDPRWGTAEPPGARYDRLADAVGKALDLDAIATLAGLSLSRR